MFLFNLPGNCSLIAVDQSNCHMNSSEQLQKIDGLYLELKHFRSQFADLCYWEIKMKLFCGFYQYFAIIMLYILDTRYEKQF